MTTERHQCSQRVYSGERWDFSGHPCSIKATVQTDDGRWWCKRHHPDAKAARDAARDMAQRELSAARDNANAEIAQLLERIGVPGFPTRSVVGKLGDPPTGAYISVDALRALAHRIDGR